MTTASPRLHLAAAQGQEAELTQFLTAGDDVNARNADGRTALFQAVLKQHTTCVEILLAAGADPSIRDNGKVFPLYVAAQYKNIAIAKALVEANADIHCIIDRPEGGTALSMAAFGGDQAMVRLLLDAGGDLTKTAAGGRYPLIVASGEAHIAVVTILLDACAKVNAMGGDGSTALTAAAQKGSCDVVKLLLERGAAVNKPNRNARTALHIAAKEGFSEVINVLTA